MGMQAVVLAAGSGTRLRPLTAEKPKGLAEVNGKPILTHCFEALTELDAAELVVVVGYRANQIIEYYGESFAGVPLTYAHQAEQCGVADAMLAASDHVTGPFMLMHGDYVFGCDLRRLVTEHRRTDAAGTLLVETVSDEVATGFGVCEFDSDGTLVGLVEKPDIPPSNVVITGFFVFEPSIFPACRAIQPSERGELELPDALDRMLSDGCDLTLVHADDWLVNVNTKADLKRAERHIEAD